MHTSTECPRRLPRTLPSGRNEMERRLTVTLAPVGPPQPARIEHRHLVTQHPFSAFARGHTCHDFGTIIHICRAWKSPSLPVMLAPSSGSFLFTKNAHLRTPKLLSQQRLFGPHPPSVSAVIIFASANSLRPSSAFVLPRRTTIGMFGFTSWSADRCLLQPRHSG